MCKVHGQIECLFFSFLVILITVARTISDSSDTEFPAEEISSPLPLTRISKQANEGTDFFLIKLIRRHLGDST